MELHDWPRPHYVSSADGEPFLFYVVFGSVDLSAALVRQTYRSEGIPGGIEVKHYRSDAHADVLNGFRKGYLWDQLKELTPDLSRRISAATECVILRGTPVDASNLNYMRDVVGLLTHFLDHGGCCVYDPLVFEWWSPEAWRERTFASGESDPHQHVAILTSLEEREHPPEIPGKMSPSLTWFHTRGMRKFGRPDLSVHHVPAAHKDAVVELINRFIEHQALGAMIPEGQPIRMASLPDGITCHHAGDLEDPEFNNVHVEIRWPAASAVN